MKPTTRDRVVLARFFLKQVSSSHHLNRGDAIRTARVKCVKISAQSFNCNPHAERFIRTIESECLNQLVFFGERHLRYVVKEFIAHYHCERFHQGLGGQLIDNHASTTTEKRTSGKVVCRSRLGGILNFYDREAA